MYLLEKFLLAAHCLKEHWLKDLKEYGVKHICLDKKVPILIDGVGFLIWFELEKGAYLDYFYISPAQLSGISPNYFNEDSKALIEIAKVEFERILEGVRTSCKKNKNKQHLTLRNLVAQRRELEIAIISKSFEDRGKS